MPICSHSFAIASSLSSLSATVRLFPFARTLRRVTQARRCAPGPWWDLLVAEHCGCNLHLEIKHLLDCSAQPTRKENVQGAHEHHCEQEATGTSDDCPAQHAQPTLRVREFFRKRFVFRDELHILDADVVHLSFPSRVAISSRRRFGASLRKHVAARRAFYACFDERGVLGCQSNQVSWFLTAQNTPRRGDGAEALSRRDGACLPRTL